MDTKECYNCKKELPVIEYGANGTSATGKPRLKPRCKLCTRLYELSLFEQKMQRIMGRVYACGCCGYDRCVSALEFHHVDPTTKDQVIARMKTYSEEKLKQELEKCILVCSNCHREIHEGIRAVLIK